MAKVFDLGEICEHTTTNDCWISIFGKVYDLSSFLDLHPGGEDVLLAATGKDATAEFEDVGHSHGASQIMEKYYIGQLNNSSILHEEPEPEPEPTPSLQTVLEKTGPKSKYMVYLVVPVIILNLIIALFSKLSA